MLSWNHRIEEAEMVRYSRWWPRVFFGLAVLILVAGAVASLVIWQTRSSSTLEVLDPGALRNTAEGVLENTSSIAEVWTGQDLSSDLDGLVVEQQQSLALLAGEIARTRDLIAEVEGRDQSEEAGSLKSSERALASLSESQSQLEEALREAGTFLASLDPLAIADTAYRAGRAELFAAVDSHNGEAASGTTSFAASRGEAASAIASLDEAAAALQAMQVEGLDTEASSAAIAELKNAAEGFIEACQKGESEDVEGHNSLMVEVQSKLSSSPDSILAPVDIPAWLRANLEPYLRSVLDAIEETRELIAEIR
jgi:hypothetical protein